MPLLKSSMLHLVVGVLFALYVGGCGNPPPLTGDGECEGVPNCSPNNVEGNNVRNNVEGNNVLNNVQNNGQNNATNDQPNDQTNECVVGETECVNATQQRRCFVDGEGTYWDDAMTCASGVCQGEACCPDTCQAGEKVCTQAGIQTCEPQPDGCLGLSAPVACPQGQQCTDQGTCVSSCTSDCTTPGDTQCFNESATRTCISVEPSCNKWSPINACQSDYICEDSMCVEECPNSCGFLDTFTPRCISGQQELCLPNPLNQFCLQWLPDFTAC